MNYLLDTNVISEWTKDQPALEVMTWLTTVDENFLFLSVISLAEIHNGLNLMPQGRRRERLTSWANAELFARFDGRIIVVDETIAAEWGRVMAQAQQGGTSIGAIDAFFAATAVSKQLTLVTRNVRDFASTEVSVVDPWSAS